MERRLTSPATHTKASSVRADKAGRHGRIAGYAAVFHRAGVRDTEYRLADNIIERIMPGAFDRAISEKDDVRGLFNHDANLILGRTAAGTMRLQADAIGLRYEIDLADTSIARDVLEHLRRGDVTGSSFGFSVSTEGEEWKHEDGMQVREIHSVRLFDVSPVTYPAYAGTSSQARSKRTGLATPQSMQRLRLRMRAAEAFI